MKTETCIRCNGTGTKTTAALITGTGLKQNYAVLDCDWCDGTGQVCAKCHGTKNLAAIKLDWSLSADLECPDCK